MKYKGIDIINFWHTNNYGANLTAFALQNILQQFGFESKLVNNPLDIKESRLKKCFRIDFQRKYLKITDKISHNANQLNAECETFITGSDQVFRPKYTQNKLAQYMLDFVELNKKKIAFSASFGVDKEQLLQETSKETLEKMKNSLKSFDFISVREKSGIKICKDLFNIDAQLIIDPVFILEKENYYKLIENGNKKIINSAQNDTIVAYVLDERKEHKRAYKYLAKKYNKKVIETANSNISVESWLKSIKECELFITDSFHGMCFAIIFNKPFICLANKFRGRTRFNSICEILNIENQCIDSIDEIYSKDCIFKIDYKKVNQRIEEERQKGLDFLKNSLDAPVKITQEKIDSKIKYLENRVIELENENNLKFQLKKQLFEIGLTIYHVYLPKFVKNIIKFFWYLKKRKA